jgi:hypothetical protein
MGGWQSALVITLLGLFILAVISLGWEGIPDQGHSSKPRK